MISARLSMALVQGALVLPEGRILVLLPQAGDDLSGLPRERVEVIQTQWPDYDHFRAQGYRVAVKAEGSAAMALVHLPRARDLGRALVAEAAALVGPEGLVLVDGQKLDGIEAMLREIRARQPVSDPVVKAHGKLFWFSPAADFSDWAALAAPRRVAGDFLTLSGSFSADGPDAGSQLLAEALPAKLGTTVADLGAGWGYLARAILAREGVKQLHLVEADHAALDLARINVPDPRAQFHWADARRWTPGKKLETVVMNPPFHAGRTADTALGAGFIAAAARLLVPSGVLWMVANRHLPYEATLSGLFREVDEITGSGSFKLYRASKPESRNAATARPAGTAAIRGARGTR